MFENQGEKPRLSRGRLPPTPFQARKTADLISAQQLSISTVAVDILTGSVPVFEYMTWR